MKLLLDTHIWLWMVSAPQQLSVDTRKILENEANQLFLSAASSWEISIKYGLGKLKLPEPPAEFIVPRLLRDGIDSLAIEHAHTVQVASLPQLHSDPFDRILIAQAQVERLVLVTADASICKYELELMRA